MQCKHPHTGPTVLNDRDEYERCVLCGRLTDIKKLTPVDARQNYIIGAGQLCKDCAQTMRSEMRFANPE